MPRFMDIYNQVHPEQEPVNQVMPAVGNPEATPEPEKKPEATPEPEKKPEATPEPEKKPEATPEPKEV